MTVRRAGRSGATSSESATWSVAEGRRGRRWRWQTGNAAGNSISVALELEPGGRFVRLEAAGDGTLLSLHAEADGSVHGHRIGPSGIAHHALATPAPRLILAGRALPALAALAAQAMGEGIDGRPVAGVVVDDDLAIEVVELDVRSLAPRSWRIGLRDEALQVELDADGLPVGPGTTTWPLEVG